MYRGLYRGREVAVKYAHKASVDDLMKHDALQTLEREAHILSRVRHQNIVRFYGGSLQPPHVFIVEELMDQVRGAPVEGVCSYASGAWRA